MKKKFQKIMLVSAILALFSGMLVACGGGSSGSSNNQPTYTLSLSTTNATLNNQAQTNIVVSISPSTNIPVTVSASNPSMVDFPTGATCTPGSTNCAIAVKNINVTTTTTPVTFTATASNSKSATLTLQFVGTTAPPPTPSDNAITLDTVTGASSTILANTNYSPTFTFINNSGIDLENLSSTFVSSGSDSFLTNAADNCEGSLKNGATCTMTGTLNGQALSTHTLTGHFTYTQNGASGTANYTQDITAVNNTDSTNQQMAVRVVNNSSTSNLYVSVITNKYTGSTQQGYVIPFAQSSGLSASSTPIYQGATNNAEWAICNLAPNNTGCPYGTSGNYVTIPPSQEAVLMISASTSPLPINATQHGISGLIYLSLDTPLATGAAPSVTNTGDANYNTRWAQFEYTLMTSDSTAPNAKPQYTVDLTAVDFISLPLKFEALQDATGVPITIGDVHLDQNMYSDLTTLGDGKDTQTILQGIETILTQATPSSDWSSLVEKNPAGNITRIISPNMASSIGGFENYFSSPVNYSKDLWDYYRTHTLKIDVSAINGCTGVIMDGSVSGSETDPAFTFTPESTPPSTCANSSSVVFNGLPGNVDFFGGAGPDSILFGANGSVQAWLGESIAATQSVGLLPFDGTLSSTAVRALKAQYYTNTQTETLSAASGNTYPNTMYNAYSQAVAQYFNYYNYPYGDFLGADGTVSNTNVQLAPITLTLAG